MRWGAASLLHTRCAARRSAALVGVCTCLGLPPPQARQVRGLLRPAADLFWLPAAAAAPFGLPRSPAGRQGSERDELSLAPATALGAPQHQPLQLAWCCTRACSWDPAVSRPSPPDRRWRRLLGCAAVAQLWHAAPSAAPCPAAGQTHQQAQRRRWQLAGRAGGQQASQRASKRAAGCPGQRRSRRSTPLVRPGCAVGFICPLQQRVCAATGTAAARARGAAAAHQAAPPLPPVPAAEKRQAEAARIRDKYPDRIPVSRAPLLPACKPPHSAPPCQLAGLGGAVAAPAGPRQHGGRRRAHADGRLLTHEHLLTRAHERLLTHAAPSTPRPGDSAPG